MVVIAVVLVVVVLAIWAITTGAIRFLGSDDPDPAAPTRTAQPTGGSTTPVTDGDLRLSLKRLRTSGTGTITATVTVTNRTAAFVSFYGESQDLVSTESRTVPGKVSLTSLEPHETATVDLVFTIPAGFRAAELQLRATPASGGVRIKLT